MDLNTQPGPDYSLMRWYDFNTSLRRGEVGRFSSGPLEDILYQESLTRERDKVADSMRRSLSG